MGGVGCDAELTDESWDHPVNVTLFEKFILDQIEEALRPNRGPSRVYFNQDLSLRLLIELDDQFHAGGGTMRAREGSGSSRSAHVRLA